MILFPAIDIKNGSCVRLVQGKMENATIFNEDPVEQARFFESKGCKWIHIVDLDGAIKGESVNKEIIFKMYNKFVKKLSKKQKENFVKEYKILATNRHLKVIGIFTRLYIRDKKKFYLKHIPRLWKLIEYNLNFYSLSELNKWINEFFPKKFRIKPKL